MKTGARGRILLGDSEPEIVRMLSLVFEDLGYEVIGTHDGDSTLRQIAEARPDVAIFDAQLQGIDGVTLSRQVKERASTSDIQVVLISISPDVDHRSAGADAFLVKPFDLDRLTQIVTDLMARRRGSN